MAKREVPIGRFLVSVVILSLSVEEKDDKEHEHMQINFKIFEPGGPRGWDVTGRNLRYR